MPNAFSCPPTLILLSQMLKRRELSPIELTTYYLERIQKLQPQLNAYITVTDEQATEQARRAEAELSAGRYRGPLHGIPISIKDIIATKGVRTTAGSKILEENIPSEDAFVVQRLADSGAVCLGKTNLHEFAFGVTSNNPHFGPVRNPWNTDSIAGGSSGGSAAAVCAGMCAASVGTDTGGSIRIPSSACGCVGLKPTYDLVSRQGVIPLSSSMDHVGPIARTVEDAAIMLMAMAGDNSRDLSGGGTDLVGLVPLTVDESFPVRIGICSEYFFANLYPQVESPVRKALGLLEERFGSIRSLEWPALQAIDNIGMVIAFAEASSYHEEWMNNRPSDYGEDTLLRLRKGLTISAVEFLRCRGLQSQLRQEAEALFEKIDILAYPTLPYVGARIGEDKVSTGLGEEDVRSASIRFNRLANLIGYPAISLPCGFSDQGLPIGLQLMAGPFKERLLLKVAHAYEAQTDWHLRSPSLVDLVDTSRITQMHPNS